MRVSKTGEIEGRRISCAIGRVVGASPWHASGAPASQQDWRAAALEKLKREAADLDADAIVELDYRVDDIDAPDTAVSLQRIRAEGIAVRLAHS